MKYFLHVFCFTLIIGFTSCKSKSIHLDRSYKEEKVTITIDAVKATSMDPWKIDLKAKVYDFNQGSLSFEQQVSELKAEDIKIDWIDDNTCIISFPYDDGKFRKFQLIATPTNFKMEEISE